MTPDVNELPTESADATLASRGWRRARGALASASSRNIYFSAVAIPGHIVMAISKGAVLFASFSAFMTATVMFTLGLARIKFLVIRAHRRVRQGNSITAVPTAYRLTGLIVLVLSGLWVVSCLPLAMGGEFAPRYNHIVALAIATMAFTELAFSVHGFFASRRYMDALMEAIKLSNLASSIILLVLTQAALLSMTPDAPAISRTNGWFGVGAGVMAALIGVFMLVRSRRGIVWPERAGDDGWTDGSAAGILP
ncbi:MAG: hypothetical protein WAX29_06780 [Propionibacterium sp.]